MDTKDCTEVIESISTGMGSDNRTVIWAYGTRDKLIESGLAADYMFEVLGDRASKGARTEYGDLYKLGRLKNNRFSLYLSLLPVPKNPHGMAHIDPYDTDISDILSRLGGAS